ncbi:MAG: hypothetical protein LUE17_02920 [Planctomycetaceae bacterium]|nr:hypothetical protein [Planctomycetaceae bacterium]
MSRRLIVASALAAALLFGVVVSGCNRNRDVAMEARRNRQESRQRARTKQSKQSRRSRAESTEHTELASLRPNGPRPAEVLASTVRRQPGRSRQPSEARTRRRGASQLREEGVQPISASEFARTEPVQPAPMYGAGYAAAPVPAAPAALAAVPSQHAYNGTEYGYPASMTVYDPPVPVVVLSPQLAMAQAALQPTFAPYPAPAAPIPTANDRDLVMPAAATHYAAPIPELEPVRYQRVATPAPAVPATPNGVMMSSRVGQTFESFRTPSVQSSEAERALAPIASPARSASEWVPSPFTAPGAKF